MRYYDILAGNKHYSAAGNPNALNVELDICVADHDSFAAGSVCVWGIALEDISQATDLNNKPFKMSAGMQRGLPFATQQASEAGVIMQGYVFSCFGNWVGTDMTLNFVVMPGNAPDQPPAPNAPNPPPKNIILNWKKGKQLSDAVKQALQTAYQGMQLNVTISSQLVAPQDNIGYYANLRELNDYLRSVSQQIVGGSTYPCVGCCMQKGEITVHDGTQPPGPKQIAFIDLVGQPTWIAPKTVIKTVMRGDMKVGDQITLPPTRVVTTGEAQKGLNTPLTFQGTFKISSLRHVGNFCQPDGSAWVTIIEALQN